METMETEGEQKARKRSHMVVYSTMFIMSVGFSIVLSGVWPYLQQLSPGIEKTTLGAVVAANPFGQMIAAPLLGLWGNMLGSIRIPCLITVVFFILGNALYAILEWFGDKAYIMMLIARFVIGISSAVVTLCRSYLGSSTTEEERNTAIAMMSIAQSLGLVAGGGIQTVLTLSIPEKIDMGYFILDKYTAAGWVTAVLGIINCIILMPGIFQEHNIAEKERALKEKNHKPANQFKSVKLPKPDVRALAVVLYGFFVSNSIIVFLDTLATPFVMDLYGWDEDFAVVVVGIGISSICILLLPMFALSSILTKKYDERKLLLIGFVPLIIGVCLCIPFTGENIVIQTQCYDNTSVKYVISSLATAEEPIKLNNLSKVYYGGQLHTDIPNKVNINDSSLVKKINNTGFLCSEEYQCACGCPVVEQPWCVDTKALPIPQLIIAIIITFVGFPIVLSISQALYSKIVGQRSQGLWMGILTSTGSLSRIVGPLSVSYVYAYLGPIVTFVIVSVLLVIAGLNIILVYKRLIPIELEDDDYRISEPILTLMHGFHFASRRKNSKNKSF